MLKILISGQGDINIMRNIYKTASNMQQNAEKLQARALSEPDKQKSRAIQGLATQYGMLAFLAGDPAQQAVIKNALLQIGRASTQYPGIIQPEADSSLNAYSVFQDNTKASAAESMAKIEGINQQAEAFFSSRQ